jgi:outer membrane lipoprotein-sorting protein
MLTSACAGTRVSTRPGREVAAETKARVLTGLKARNESLKSLKGFATVRYGAGIFSGRGEAAFLTESPNRARIDALTDFGVSQSQLALSDDRLTVFWPSASQFFEGEASPERLAAYAGVGLSPDVLVGILLGKIPLGDREDDSWRVTLSDAGDYRVKGEGLEVTAQEIGGEFVPQSYTVFSAEGRPVYRVSFEGYSKDGRPVNFADRVTARMWKEGESRTKARIDVVYRDLEINPKVDPKVFELNIPNDAQRVSE